jgi:hypothetical protein
MKNILLMFYAMAFIDLFACFKMILESKHKRTTMPAFVLLCRALTKKKKNMKKLLLLPYLLIFERKDQIMYYYYYYVDLQ